MCNCGSNTVQPREGWTSAQAQAAYEASLAAQAAAQRDSASAAVANAGGGQQ